LPSGCRRETANGHGGTDARRFVTLDVFTIGASPAKLASPHWKVEIVVIAAR
jgi:hypothetical protein